ncbi:phytoene desaturase family protein [Sphingobacterium griseoflavum]|uniref:All-trans-retinol 13,14-reductase n=1 Tax=Sphingobacterium griseoflavum TaxID=1474952 RepID=A0ABQ3HWI4_9SPHI|nr:NAD(P)/FAD-dependent oxidoreductase [Sphingobacterium griseoflavum]GHE40697.1 all-trans-retinol 13,14-reductase [Sphingobacterium griseoflavum]
MISERSKYDVVIVGSGLGGLVTAVTLAKEGKRVCILEKNSQFGGNLQTFARHKKLFDTGVHYIGGLGKGQNLYQYFSYLGIMSDLKVERMPPVFDYISFGDKETLFPIAQGYQAFIEHLLPHFPNERNALQQYVKDLDYVCHAFPLYYVEDGEGYKTEVLYCSVKDYFRNLTQDERLRSVLVGNNFLYAGEDDKTPFYVHALALNAYLLGAYRCPKGGSQISKLLIRELLTMGGVACKREEVVSLDIDAGKVAYVTTHSGKQFHAELFVLNIDPKRALQLVGREYFRKPFFDRVQQLPVTTSACSVHIVLKPNKIRYQAYNLYHHDSLESVWQATRYRLQDWPAMFMLSMTADSANPAHADTLTLLTYMHFEEVGLWEDTHNTVVNPSARGEAYERFKANRADVLIEKASKYIPGLKDAIAHVHVSTPLSYRDYIGMYHGNLYGHVKDVTDPLKTFIAPKTKVENLFLTGHGIYMHGILGVTIGAMATCGEIVGKTYLLEKIRRHYTEQATDL